MRRAFKTFRKRSSMEMAAFVMRPFLATLLPSTMPGTRLCTRVKTAVISETTSLASPRQLFMSPGLRFCGMAEDTYVFSPPSCRMIQGRLWAYCTMMSLIMEPTCTPTEAATDDTSSAKSTGVSHVQSKALRRGRSNPRSSAIVSRFRGQPVPFNTVAPIGHSL